MQLGKQTNKQTKKYEIFPIDLLSYRSVLSSHRQRGFFQPQIRTDTKTSIPEIMQRVYIGGLHQIPHLRQSSKNPIEEEAGKIVRVRGDLVLWEFIHPTEF